MASCESKATRIIDKFNKGRFNFWKFKIKMLLAFMDLWDIMDGSEKSPSFNVDSKVLKVYQGSVKKAMSIIGLNFADNQFAHIKSCKRLAEAW